MMTDEGWNKPLSSVVGLIDECDSQHEQASSSSIGPRPMQQQVCRLIPEATECDDRTGLGAYHVEVSGQTSFVLEPLEISGGTVSVRGDERQILAYQVSSRSKGTTAPHDQDPLQDEFLDVQCSEAQPTEDSVSDPSLRTRVTNPENDTHLSQYPEEEFSVSRPVSMQLNITGDFTVPLVGDRILPFQDGTDQDDLLPQEHVWQRARPGQDDPGMRLLGVLSNERDISDRLQPRLSAQGHTTSLAAMPKDVTSPMSLTRDVLETRSEEYMRYSHSYAGRPVPRDDIEQVITDGLQCIRTEWIDTDKNDHPRRPDEPHVPVPHKARLAARGILEHDLQRTDSSYAAENVPPISSSLAVSNMMLTHSDDVENAFFQNERMFRDPVLVQPIGGVQDVSVYDDAYLTSHQIYLRYDGKPSGTS